MLFVVTPVHNRKEISRRFLQCLQEQHFREFEVVIVDDGSTDGTSEMVMQTFPAAILLKGDGDLWWSGGTNMGLRYVLARASDDDYVLIINDDLEIDPDYIERLLSFARRHPRALVGSVVVDLRDPDVIWDGGHVWNWTTAKHRILNRGKHLSSFPLSTYYEVSHLTGRGMLAPVRVFREIGLYDAKNFRHRGDTELPVRARKRGYKLLVFYGAKVKSHIGMTHPSEMNRYRLADCGRYFFDFRSSGSIAFRFMFALKSSTSPLQFLSFLMFDLARTGVHFFSNCDYSLTSRTSTLTPHRMDEMI